MYNAYVKKKKRTKKKRKEGKGQKDLDRIGRISSG